MQKRTKYDTYKKSPKNKTDRGILKIKFIFPNHNGFRIKCGMTNTIYKKPYTSIKMNTLKKRSFVITLRALSLNDRKKNPSIQLHVLIHLGGRRVLRPIRRNVPRRKPTVHQKIQC